MPILSFLCILFFWLASTEANHTCAQCEQVVFLMPPSDFDPQFEVAGCFIESQGKVLLLMRNPDEPQGTSWCVPGGRLESKETAADALIREVKEKTDLTLSCKELSYARPVYVCFPDRHFILHLFCTHLPSPPPLHLAWEKCTDFIWVTKEQVFELPLIPGGKECFQLLVEEHLFRVEAP